MSFLMGSSKHECASLKCLIQLSMVYNAVTFDCRHPLICDTFVAEIVWFWLGDLCEALCIFVKGIFPVALHLA